MAAMIPARVGSTLRYKGGEERMAMLKIRCEKCKALIATGFDMSYEAFRSATLTQHSTECPNCEHLQTWTFDDVDRSSVPTPNTPR
jgi:hypothetical protein